MKVGSNGKFMAALFLIFCSTLIGCDHSSTSETSGDARVGSYEYTDDNCGTGKQSYTSHQELCQKLTDEDLNRHCAEGQRKIDFYNRCQGFTWPSAGSTLNPVGDICARPSSLSPKGPEIPLERFIDGLGGFYRMTDMTGVKIVKQGSEHGAINVYATVGTDQSLDKPVITQGFTCKNMADAANGDFSGNFNEPIVIQRDSGILKGSIKTEFEIYGPNVHWRDSLSSSVASNYNVPTLRALQQSEFQTGRELHIYQINSVTFELVISGTQTVGDQSFESRSSAIYLYQAPATATPAPPVTPTPAPSDSGSAAAIAKICNGYYDTSDKVSCLLKLKDANVSANVIPICASYYDTSDKVGCLEKLNQKTVQDELVAVCKQYYDTSDEVACLQKLAGLNISQQYIATCRQYYDVSDKVSCLLKFAQ